MKHLCYKTTSLQRPATETPHSVFHYTWWKCMRTYRCLFANSSFMLPTLLLSFFVTDINSWNIQEGDKEPTCVSTSRTYVGVTCTSHGCHMHITWVSHVHHMVVTCTSHGCHMHITWLSHAHHMAVTCTSHGCHIPVVSYTVWVQVHIVAICSFSGVVIHLIPSLILCFPLPFPSVPKHHGWTGRRPPTSTI